MTKITNANPLIGIDDIEFGMTRKEVRDILGEAEEFMKSEFDDNSTDDSDGPISYDKSIGIYAPDGEMESMLLGVKGYYNE